MRATYFIQAGDGTGPVKIGVASNLRRRLDALQTGNAERLTIIRAVTGGCAVERHFHDRFTGRRVRGEWFSFCPEMLTAPPPAGSHEITDLPTAPARERSPIDDVIEALGGSRGVAERFGVGTTAVSNWRVAGVFPERLHLRVFNACRDLGINYIPDVRKAS